MENLPNVAVKPLALAMGIQGDHVYLLTKVDPQFGVHKVVKKIKGYSFKVLGTEFPWLKSRLPSLWTNSYFVSTVGGAPLAVIKQYIENQKKCRCYLCGYQKR